MEIHGLPERPDPAGQDETLMNEEHDPRVFVIIGGAKFWIQNPDDFVNLGYDWNAIRRMPDGTLANYSDVPVDGTLVQEQYDTRVFVVLGGAKFYIQGPHHFDALGYNWGNIKRIPRQGLDQIPNIPQERTVIAEYGDSVVYLVHGGARHGAVNEAALQAWDRSLADLIVIPPGGLAQVPAGDLLQPPGDGTPVDPPPDVDSEEPPPGQEENEGPDLPEEPDPEDLDPDPEQEDNGEDSGAADDPMTGVGDTTASVTPIVTGLSSAASESASQLDLAIKPDPKSKKCPPPPSHTYSCDQDTNSPGESSEAGVTATTPARRFDVVWRQPPAYDDQCRWMVLCDAQFARLNKAPAHYLAMPRAKRRKLIEEQGNQLAAYYNELNTCWPGYKCPPAVRTGAVSEDNLSQMGTATPPSAEQKVQGILKYCEGKGFPKNGRYWIILNEIAFTLWKTNKVYRQWVIKVAQLLENRGHKVIVLSPLSKAGLDTNLDGDWSALSKHAYIAIEGYLNSQKIWAKRKAGGHEAARKWCEEQYRSFKQAYMRSVPKDRLFLVEHFAHTKRGQFIGKKKQPLRWGRLSLGLEQWKEVIEIRCQAARNVEFHGFVSYGWTYNQMGVSEQELNESIKAYMDAARQLP